MAEQADPIPPSAAQSHTAPTNEDQSELTIPDLDFSNTGLTFDSFDLNNEQPFTFDDDLAASCDVADIDELLANSAQFGDLPVSAHLKQNEEQHQVVAPQASGPRVDVADSTGNTLSPVADDVQASSNEVPTENGTVSIFGSTSAHDETQIKDAPHSPEEEKEEEALPGETVTESHKVASCRTVVTPMVTDEPSGSPGLFVTENDDNIQATVNRDEAKDGTERPEDGELEEAHEASGELDQEEDARSEVSKSQRTPSPVDEGYEPSQPPTPSASEHFGSEDPSPLNEHQYQLRQNGRDTAIIVGSWVDRDDSGNYDPNNENPVKPSTKSRSVGIQRRDTADGTHPRKRQKTMAAVRQSGDRYCITLKLTSNKGLALLKQYESENNWPDDDCVKYVDERGGYVADDNLSDSSTTAHYMLRRRISDINELEEDFTGRPEGRGCKVCRAVGVPCSMLEPDGAYPCDMCVEEEDDCEPLVPPIKKQPCENCRHKSQSCSYAYEGSDHSQPCDFCKDREFKCIAGPLPDPTRVRMDADGNPAIPKDRGPRYKMGKFRSCAQCRRGHKTCSLLKTKGEPPCTHCKEQNTPCTFEAVKHNPQPAPAKPPPPLPTNPYSPATKAAPSNDDIIEQSPPVVTPHKSGRIDTIRTALSHPITFNAIPNDILMPCHWCTGNNPFYPLYGQVQGVREVKVLQWKDRRGCNELANGYTLAGAEPSRMCALCTFVRVKIMFCRRHVFRRVSSLAPEIEDEALQGGRKHPAKALRQLGSVWNEAKKKDLATRGSMMRAELGCWCATCPAMATHECCAGGTPSQLGCGLRLCRICFALVSNAQAYDGNFVRFVKEAEEKIKRAKEVEQFFPKGLRADYSFFAWEGYMMRQVRAAQMEKMGKKKK